MPAYRFEVLETAERSIFLRLNTHTGSQSMNHDLPLRHPLKHGDQKDGIIAGDLAILIFPAVSITEVI